MSVSFPEAAHRRASKRLSHKHWQHIGGATAEAVKQEQPGHWLNKPSTGQGFPAQHQFRLRAFSCSLFCLRTKRWRLRRCVVRSVGKADEGTTFPRMWPVNSRPFCELAKKSRELPVKIPVMAIQNGYAQSLLCTALGSWYQKAWHVPWRCKVCIP